MRLRCGWAALMWVLGGLGTGEAGAVVGADATSVAGTWSGTSTGTVTAGPSCIGRQPITVPAVAQITQSGTSVAVALTLNQAITCTSHGTVSGTTISLSQDAQQANPSCLAVRGIPCLDQGTVHFIDLTVASASLTGTVAGDAITASGMSTDNVLDSQTQQVIGTLQATVQLDLQRGGAGGSALSLSSGRFAVTATWMNQFNGTAGAGVAIPSTDSTGFFYFTDPSNYELVVKILDIDGVIKVFYTELTDLLFTITVTDRRDGTVKTYGNTPGDCGAIDENAFAGVSPGPRAVAKGGSCAPGSHTLCLLDRRFAVSVDWMNQFNGTSGQGSPRSLSDQSGLFSFTDPTDVELVMKVVDFGDRTAFFWGALSDFAYDIAVTDTVNGTSKTYHNAAGHYCGGLDNNAFPP